jgi:hypothetical protein
MINGKENFSVYIEEVNGEIEFEMDIKLVSTEHLYKVCFTICKMIEEGSFKENIEPLNWNKDNLTN